MALAHGGARGIRVGAFAAIAAVLVGGVLWADPERVITGFLSDDAFYYLKIARSIAEGRGSTFDGLHPTNGYHPLWMLVVVGVTALAPAGLVPPALAVIVLSIGMGLATLAVVARVVGRYLAPGLAAVGEDEHVGAGLLRRRAARLDDLAPDQRLVAPGGVGGLGEHLAHGGRS